jgi:hypothetical protein
LRTLRDMGSKASKTPGPLARATAGEVRAELGRRGMVISDLDGVIGSHAYVWSRLSVNASQSLDFTDVESLCDLLGIEPLVLFQRAKAALKESGPQGSQE